MMIVAITHTTSRHTTSTTVTTTATITGLIVALVVMVIVGVLVIEVVLTLVSVVMVMVVMVIMVESVTVVVVTGGSGKALVVTVCDSAVAVGELIMDLNFVYIIHWFTPCYCLLFYSPDGSSDSDGVIIVQPHISGPSPGTQRRQWIGFDTLAPMFMN